MNRIYDDDNKEQKVLYKQHFICWIGHMRWSNIKSSENWSTQHEVCNSDAVWLSTEMLKYQQHMNASVDKLFCD